MLHYVHLNNAVIVDYSDLEPVAGCRRYVPFHRGISATQTSIQRHLSCFYLHIQLSYLHLSVAFPALHAQRYSTLRNESHRRSGLATLPSVGAVP